MVQSFCEGLCNFPHTLRVLDLSDSQMDGNGTFAFVSIMLILGDSMHVMITLTGNNALALGLEELSVAGNTFHIEASKVYLLLFFIF